MLVDFLEIGQTLGVIQQLVVEILPNVHTKFKNMKKLKVTKKAEKELFLTKFRLFNDRTVLSGILTAEKKEIEKNKMIREGIIDAVLYLGKQGLVFRGHREYKGLGEPMTNEGRIEDLHDVDLELVIAEERQRLLVAGRVEAIADDEDQAAPPHPLRESAEAREQRSRVIDRGCMAQKLEDFVELALAAREPEIAPERLAKPREVHAVEIREGDVAERGGDAAGVVEFGRRSKVEGRRRGPLHRRAGVDEEMHVEILLLLEKLHEKPIEARIDIPVDRAQIVAERVVAVVGEFEARSALARAALGMVFAAKNLPREQMELLELGEESGIEEKRRGGQSADMLPGARTQRNRALLSPSVIPFCFLTELRNLGRNYGMRKSVGFYRSCASAFS